MNAPPAKLSILLGEKFACVKVVGWADMRSSPDLKTVMGKLLSKGYRYFVLDLSECSLMDSTFLGTLVKFGLEVNPPAKKRSVVQVSVLTIYTNGAAKEAEGCRL